MSKPSSTAIRSAATALLGLWMAGEALAGGSRARAAGPACTRAVEPAVRWVSIPGGTNILGSRAGRADEAPHPVALPPFRMAATETTVGQFLAYLEESGSACASPLVERRNGHWRATVPPDRPMTQVTQQEARDFARWLSQRTGRAIRLPTGDEWEYAARGGVDGAPFPWGWDSPTGRACFAAAAPAPVGRGEPSRWGLYDLAGNAAEWCEEPGETRGGSWADRGETALRVYRRTRLPAGYADADTGFRLCGD